MSFPCNQSVDLKSLRSHLINNVLLLPFCCSFLEYFAARTPFPTQVITFSEAAHPTTRKLINLISFVRSSDTVDGMLNCGKENKAGDSSVGAIDSLKNV